MNRKERRMLEKQGASKETLDKLSMYDKPCSVVDVVKLARAVAEDVLSDKLSEYHKRTSGTIISMTIQLELIKKIVVEKGLTTLEELQELYKSEVSDFESKQADILKSMHEEMYGKTEVEESPATSASFGDTKVNLDVTVERRGAN